MVNNDPYNDPAWDADVDALNGMSQLQFKSIDDLFMTF